MIGAVRVAYTLEQCWHRVPGGTGVAAMRVAEAMGAAARRDAARRGRAPRPRARASRGRRPIPIGPSARRRRRCCTTCGCVATGRRSSGRPGPIDVAHATTVIPCATDAPLVVTVHDLAFLHDPSQFTRRGNCHLPAQPRSTSVAAPISCCAAARRRWTTVSPPGIAADRLRLVPLGVEVDQGRRRPRSPACARAVPAARALPAVRRHGRAAQEPARSGRGGRAARRTAAAGRGRRRGLGRRRRSRRGGDVRFLGFVPAADLGGLYAGAEVFCYPSEREGYGLPVLEAMAQGTPVVTSRGTATEETAGGAAVLVDPLDPDRHRPRHQPRRSRPRRALARAGCGPRRSGAAWRETARLTAAAYRELC